MASPARSSIVALVILCAGVARADDEEAPKRWEELFYPFPIVGAPPQLEQQIQLTSSYFRGGAGSGEVAAAELAYILAPHLGAVLTVPFQFGFDGQTTGFEDVQVALQALVAGSIEHDAMLSLGITSTLPTGRGDLSAGALFFGFFAYGAKRFFHRLIFEANATALMPFTNGTTARQILGTGVIALMLTPRNFDVPIYLQVEANSTTYLAGTTGLPPGATTTPAETVFIAPEVFLGPFKTPISKETRVVTGVAFNAYGDATHAQTYTLSVAFDIPNPYGY